MDADEKITLIATHTERRRTVILEAFEAMEFASAEDRKLVAKWLIAGKVNELELGQLIANYRECLGRMYDNPKQRRFVKDLA